MSGKFWIVAPFSAMFLILFAVFGAFFAACSLYLRRKEDAVRRRFLAGLMLFTLLTFAVYKYFLSIDADYSAITAAAGTGAFNWWGELPLQLCNINMLLLPYAVLRDRRGLMSFAFFAGPLGALLALVMPGIGFAGYSLLLPRMIGFYFTHFMVFFGGISLYTFGIYRPGYRDVLPTAGTIVLVAAAIYAVDMLLRWTALNTHANYFFLVETEGNAVLELFYSVIPVPFLYILPVFAVLPLYMYLLVFLLERRGRKKQPV